MTSSLNLLEEAQGLGQAIERESINLSQEFIRQSEELKEELTLINSTLGQADGSQELNRGHFCVIIGNSPLDDTLDTPFLVLEFDLSHRNMVRLWLLSRFSTSDCLPL